MRDLKQCRIATPTGSARVALYRMLGEVFPPDRELFASLIESGRPYATWTPYTLYDGEEILGNVALMPLKVWLGGRPVEVVGVASVATAPRYRRQGIARYLLQHCLALADRDRLPAVLFTGQPEVYDRHGFVRIAPRYTECRLDDWPFHHRSQEKTWLDCPTAEQWKALGSIYADDYPNYDGKLLRDACYRPLYQTLFRLNPHWRIVACGTGGRWLGYARCEAEPGRLLVSEFCCDPGREEAAESLLSAIGVEAGRLGRTVVSWALPTGHFVDGLLRSHGVAQAAEGTGAGREVFMVRPAAGEPLGPLARLSWPLADKF